MICGGKSRELLGEIKLSGDEDEFIILQIRKSWRMTVYDAGRSCRLGRKRFMIHTYTYAGGLALRLRERARAGFRTTTLLKSCTPGCCCYLKPAATPARIYGCTFPSPPVIYRSSPNRD